MTRNMGARAIAQQARRRPNTRMWHPVSAGDGLRNGLLMMTLSNTEHSERPAFDVKSRTAER